LKPNLRIAATVCLAASIAAPAWAADSGADTYKTKCAMCHAADGSGNTPAGKVFKAASLTDPMVTTKSNDELTAVIKNGKNKMPAWKDKLTDDQIKAVIGYIRALPPS
jgi:cytochrome c6